MNTINLIIGVICLAMAIVEHRKSRKIKWLWSGWNYCAGVVNILVGLIALNGTIFNQTRTTLNPNNMRPRCRIGKYVRCFSTSK